MCILTDWHESSNNINVSMINELIIKISRNESYADLSKLSSDDNTASYPAGQKKTWLVCIEVWGQNSDMVCPKNNKTRDDAEKKRGRKRAQYALAPMPYSPVGHIKLEMPYWTRKKIINKKCQEKMFPILCTINMENRKSLSNRLPKETILKNGLLDAR